MGLATFKGGIHPPDKKALAANSSVTEAKPPKIVVIPLSQHAGAPCKPVVTIGQEVKKGEMIGEPGGFVSAPVHSSVSGKVVAIAEFMNAMGRMVNSVVIENDGKEEWTALRDAPDYMNLSIEELKEKIKAAGIVGLGGAAFPDGREALSPEGKADRYGSDQRRGVRALSDRGLPAHARKAEGDRRGLEDIDEDPGSKKGIHRHRKQQTRCGRKNEGSCSRTTGNRGPGA